MTEALAKVRRAASHATIATLLLIAIGGFVRISGSGLGCGNDWPHCFGRWVPPLTKADLPAGVDPDQVNLVKAWIEYLNRWAGVIIGFFILGAWISTWRHARSRKDLVRAATIALAGVVFQGWFGGQVVRRDLDPRFVSVHLIVAVLIAAALLHVAVAAGNPPAAPRSEEARGRLRALGGLATGLLALSAVQVVLGAVVRGTIDVIVKARPDLARAAWLDEVGATDFVHRKLALLILVLALYQSWQTLRARGQDPGAVPRPWLSHANSALAVSQVGAGVLLAYGGFPAAAQLFHVAFGSFLVCGLYWQMLELRRASAAA